MSDKEPKNKPSDQEYPRWLEELQQKSWEPEILLSGIVLYGMFQAPELLDDFLRFFKLNIYGYSSDIDNLVNLLKVAINWLIFGLILHLISRGVWVGMVGLSFTFPNGIHHPSLKLTAKFESRIKKIPTFTQIIISLEKLCSSLFSISFMLFMSMVGGYLYFFVLIIIPVFSYVFIMDDWTGLNNPFWTIYSITVLAIGAVGFIDFVTLGFLKRVKFVSRIYWPLYRLISILTLARFYRPIYYSIVSNYSKWKISLFLIVFVAVSVLAISPGAPRTYPGERYSLISMWHSGQPTSAFTGYYDDQNEDIQSVWAHIQSDIIRTNTVRMFVVQKVHLEDSIKANCGYDLLQAEMDTTTSIVDLKCLSQFYQVLLNDSVLTDLSWKYHYKAKTQQRGLLTWIGIRNLEEGIHEIKLRGPEGMYTYDFATIPFYREINNDLLYLPEPIKSNQGEEEADFMKLKPILPK